MTPEEIKQMFEYLDGIQKTVDLLTSELSSLVECRTFDYPGIDRINNRLDDIEFALRIKHVN